MQRNARNTIARRNRSRLFSVLIGIDAIALTNLAVVLLGCL